MECVCIYWLPAWNISIFRFLLCVPRIAPIWYHELITTHTYRFLDITMMIVIDLLWELLLLLTEQLEVTCQVSSITAQFLLKFPNGGSLIFFGLVMCSWDWACHVFMRSRLDEFETFKQPGSLCIAHSQVGICASYSLSQSVSVNYIYT